MATNQIMFGGNILPCTVERFPDIHKAQRKFRQYNIPGRNGDIFFQDDAYDNVLQSYQIYAGDGTYGSQEPWTELARCLYLDGYQELRDTYDPTHFRKAVFNGPIDVENSWNTHGRATIEFNCRPERYLVDGNNPMDFPGTGTLNMRVVNYADLSSTIQGLIDGANLGSGPFFVFDFPSETGIDASLFFLQNRPRTTGATVIVGVSCPVGTETSATSSVSTVKTSVGHVKYGSELSRTDYGSFFGASVILPQTVTSGETPVLYFFFSTIPRYRLIQGTEVVRNNYMPTYPSIILHRTATYSGELSACQIGAYSIWITYDASSPYYFIDTENFSATKSATLTGDRELANNVRIDPGIKLERGENNIFTSAFFDLTLTPNWWEL